MERVLPGAGGSAAGGSGYPCPRVGRPGPRQAGEAYASFVEVLSEEQFRRRPAPDEWTAAEITGHVSEAPLTFANHARRLAAEGGGKAGRPPEDPGRLAAVARLANRGPKEGA